jgi:hypothetical protein
MRQLGLRQLEPLIWLLLAALVLGRMTVQLTIYAQMPTSDVPFSLDFAELIARDFYFDVFLAIIMCLFPIVFRLNFLRYPLELLREQSRARERPTAIILPARKTSTCTYRAQPFML